jgi:hypothetical protein
MPEMTGYLGISFHFGTLSNELTSFGNSTGSQNHSTTRPGVHICTECTGVLRQLTFDNRILGPNNGKFFCYSKKGFSGGIYLCMLLMDELETGLIVGTADSATNS